MRQAYVVVYSGGMDSFTVLHLALETMRAQGGDKYDVYPISFDYGQRHRKELRYASEVTQDLGLHHEILALGNLTPLLRGSALTSPKIEVPEGHYESESMKLTVVPGRNTLMLGIAMAYAESLVIRGMRYDQANVWYGAHSGDHHIYPDCRPEFVQAMQEVYHQATEDRVRLVAPFLYGNKETILREGVHRLGLDYARTWTCYKGGQEPCGVCGACQERAEAFAAIGQPDPALTIGRNSIARQRDGRLTA